MGGESQEEDYEFFQAGEDGRKDGQKPVDKRYTAVGALVGAGIVGYMARCSHT